MSSPTTFHLSPLLHPEIRRKIYNYVFNERQVVQLDLKRAPRYSSLNTKVYRLVASVLLNDVDSSISILCLHTPAFLRVWKESRSEALKLLTPAFQNRAFVNPATDTFDLQNTRLGRLVHFFHYRDNSGYDMRIPCLAQANIASRIQYPTLPLNRLFPDGSQRSGPEQTVQALSKMSTLKEVLVVFHVKADPSRLHQGGIKRWIFPRLRMPSL
jgi:hypothetical protein